MRATVVAAPHVDGGLPVGGVVLAHSMIDKVRDRFTNWLPEGLPPGFVEPRPEIEMTPDALTVDIGRTDETKCVVTTRVDGVVQAAIVPEPSRDALIPEEVKSVPGQYCPES